MGTTLRCHVIYRLSQQSPRLIQDGSPDLVTVIETISGHRRVLSSMIINKGCGHYMGWYAYLKKKDWAVFGVWLTG